jgi:Holliday junction resolvase
MHHLFAFGAEVRGQLLVELSRTILAVVRASGESDDVVLDVVGVNRDRAVDVA